MGRRSFRFPLDWNAIFTGYFSCVSSLIKSGNVVIADCPIYNPSLQLLFNTFIEPISPKYIVKISCSLNELERREVLRKDRALGTAKAQFYGIHQHINHDCLIESEQLQPSEAAK